MPELRVSSDPADVDLDAVHAFISRSYWAEGIPRETRARAIAHSIPFSALLDGRQIGFARLHPHRASRSAHGDHEGWHLPAGKRGWAT